MDDEQHIHRHSSFGCHVADSDVAPKMCVEKMKEGGDRGLTYCGWQQCQALSLSDDDTWSLLRRLGFVVDGWEEGCGLLIVPKSNIGKCRCSNQATAYLADAGFLYFNGSMA